MSNDEEKVEVFELSQDEWDRICQRRLDSLGITIQQLKEKHDSNTMSTQEFKVWMLVSSSTLLD